MADTYQQRFIEIRKVLGYSQTRMAEALGMSLRAVSDLETKKSECRRIHWLAAEQLLARPEIDPPPVIDTTTNCTLSDIPTMDRVLRERDIDTMQEMLTRFGLRPSRYEIMILWMHLSKQWGHAWWYVGDGDEATRYMQPYFVLKGGQRVETDTALLKEPPIGDSPELTEAERSIRRHALIAAQRHGWRVDGDPRYGDDGNRDLSGYHEERGI